MGLKTYRVYSIDGNGDADYSALSFELKFSGREVSEVCEEILNGKGTAVYDEGDTYFRVTRKYETMDRVAFFAQRDTQDYDDSKHQKLYMEGETIPA